MAFFETPCTLYVKDELTFENIANLPRLTKFVLPFWSALATAPTSASAGAKEASNST